MKKFTKMQGLGNDYVYMDCTESGEPSGIHTLAKFVSNRHFGIRVRWTNFNLQKQYLRFQNENVQC